MNKIRILITDTHFGVKQNSITWLNSQKRFIYEQFIPKLTELSNSGETFEIVHLGDVFDSRSSISTLIATEVVEIFKKLCEIKGCEKITIIAGNHDFYSPNSDEIDSINLLLNNSSKINIVSTDIQIHEKDCLYVPWYKWFDQDNIQKLIDEYNIKHVFTHADIITSPVYIKNANIFSGHTHNIYIKNNIYNLGSCYHLNFGDFNSPRGYYIMYEKDDNMKLQFIENINSIRFWVLNDETLFNPPSEIKDWDYIELRISQNNINKDNYIECINKFINNYKNTRIMPIIENNKIDSITNFEQYDIESTITKLIPEHLKSKFNKIIENKNTSL